MVVHFATIAFDVVVLWCALCDLEFSAGYDDVGCIGGARPLLAIFAVAECSSRWFT
jgi:hypothetical protein